MQKDDADRVISVKIEVPSSLAPMFGAKNLAWLTLQQTLKEGVSMNDLLNSFALTFPDFKAVFFDGESGNISGRIDIVLNGIRLELAEVKGRILANSDVIVFVPAYSGV